MAEVTRERVLWKGHGVCTVVELQKSKRGKRYKLRDEFGFITEDVPGKDVERLSADDERAQFKVKSD